MSAEQIIEKVSEEVMRRSQECERGIVGDRTMDGIPIGAYVRIAPNCLLYVQPCGAENAIDFCLN